MFSFTDRQNRTFTLLFFGMFIVHACFMAVKFSGSLPTISWNKPKTEAIKVTFLPTTNAPGAKRQIVQSEDSASKDKPKDKAFLSDKDRSFDRETIARNVEKFNKAGLGNAAKTQVAQKGATAAPAKKAAKEIKLSDLGMPSMEPIKKDVSRAPASIAPSVASKSGRQNGDAASTGLSATNDYVQEVGLGDFTQLNTVEYKFYGFFHRIRQKLEQFWGKSIQEKSHALFKAGRRLPASQDLITSLQVTLNAKGEIVNVKIMGASGVKELDDAAIDSFNEAGPFPNPPKDLLVNGQATIEWGFVVKS